MMKSSFQFSTDTLGQLQVTTHDGNSLGVDSAEIGVFIERYHVGLGGFLQAEHGRCLESQVLLERMGDLPE